MRGSQSGRFGTDDVPPLSVVMPVHNALPYLDKAIESILAQSYAGFEFVILDDASTDGSTHRLRDWAKKDERIRLLEVTQNLGPVESSNMVARAARAPFVARMDADDISYPDRLMSQLELLQSSRAIGVVASLADVIDSAGRRVRGPEAWRLSRQSPFVPFAHGAMMYRQTVFEAVGGYRPACEYWEDQDLVLRMGSVAEVMVDPFPHYAVRQSTTSTRNTSSSDRLERALDLEYRVLDRCLAGAEYSDAFRDCSGQSGKVDPRAFISRGSVILWAGKRPKLFGRLLARGNLRPRLSTFAALVWTAWAQVYPSSLRAFLLLLLKARNRMAPGHSSLSEPRSWRPNLRVSPVADLRTSLPTPRQREKASTAAR